MRSRSLDLPSRADAHRIRSTTLGSLLALTASLAVLAAACGNQAAERDYEAGNIYWAPADNGAFFVFKVLDIDDDAIHIRIFSNGFAEPPSSVDESTLYIDEFGTGPLDGTGFAHTFVEWRWFDGWETGLVQESTVRDEELDAYRRWLTEQSPAFSD